MDKVYKILNNIGGSKYCISFHDGVKQHKDGSDFYDVKLTNNKKEFNTFVKDLNKKGYKEK